MVSEMVAEATVVEGRVGLAVKRSGKRWGRGGGGDPVRGGGEEADAHGRSSSPTGWVWVWVWVHKDKTGNEDIYKKHNVLHHKYPMHTPFFDI